MQWLNEPASWQRAGDVIKVDVDPGTDFWRETGYGYTHDTGHVYGEVLPGDLDVSVRMRANFTAANDQAGIMLRADERTWLKTGLEVFDGRPRLSTVLTLGQSSWMMAELPAVDEITLRVSRRGDAVEVRYAAGDGPSQLGGLVYLPPDVEVLAGVMCAAPEGTGFGVTFRDLRIVRRDWAEDSADAAAGGAGEVVAGGDGDGEDSMAGASAVPWNTDGDGETSEPWDAGEEAGAGWETDEEPGTSDVGKTGTGWDDVGEPRASWDDGAKTSAPWDAGEEGETGAGWKTLLEWDRDPEGAAAEARAGGKSAGAEEDEPLQGRDAVPAGEATREDAGEATREDAGEGAGAPGTVAAAEGSVTRDGGQGGSPAPADGEGAHHEEPGADGDPSGYAEAGVSDPAGPDEKVTEAESGPPAVGGRAASTPPPAPAAPGPSERPDPADEWISLLTRDPGEE